MARSQLISQDLPINRDLLNPKFEGYKLSLEEIKVKEVKLPGSGVLEIELSADLFSYQQIRAFSQINYLVVDPWNRKAVYWINKELEIVGYADNENNSISGLFVSAKIPNRQAPTETQIKEFHVGLSFPDPTHAVIFDGTGRLLLALCPNRTGKPEEKWKIEATEFIGRESALIISTTSWKRGDSDIFEVVLLSVEEYLPEHNTEKNENKTVTQHKEFRTVLEWLSISRNKDNRWIAERTRLLKGKSVPNYMDIEKDGKALSICGESVFQFVSDTAKPVVNLDDQVPESVPEELVPIEAEYGWLQTPEDITVRFVAPPGLTKQQLQFVLTSTSIQLIHDSGKVLLDGKLFSSVHIEESSWTVDSNIVKVTLRKTEQDKWTEVVSGDAARGKEVFSDEEMTLMTERLSGITSDKWLTQQEMKRMNPEQLEECDSVPEVSASWIRLDGESHKTTHKIDMSGNQFLFTAILDPNEAATICLRYDVDGLLFRPSEPKDLADSVVSHVGTFSALGYVMASKQDKKFASSSPSTSFAALCDSERNVYIYRNDVPVDSILLNRKSGKVVKKIAKQHVLSLEKTGRILGFGVNDKSIFVLKSDALLVANL